MSAGVGKSFLTLGAGESISRVIGFVASILLARRLGPAGFGMVALAHAVVLYCQYVADFGVHTLGVREVAARPASAPVLVPSLVAGRLLVAAGLVAAVAAAGLLLMPQPEGAVLALYSLTLLFVALNTRWALLGLERPAPVAAARLAGEALLLLLVWLMVRDVGDLALAPLFQIAGDALAVLVLFLVLRRSGQQLRLAVDWNAVRSTFGQAWPLVVHSLLGLVIYNSDLLVLRLVRDSSAVGLYSSAYALVSFLSNLGVAYGLALLPAFTREGAGLGGGGLYTQALIGALAGALPAAVGTSLVAGGVIDMVYGERYASAGIVLAVLVWSVPLALVRTVAQTALIARGRQDLVLRTTTFAAAANVALNLALIPVFGMVGAAAVTVATELVRTVLTFVMTAREGVRTGALARAWKIAAAVAVMAAAVWLVPGWHVLARVAAGAAVYGAMLAVMGELPRRSAPA